MQTFLKVQAASLLASGADFTVTFLLVTLGKVWYLPASVTGAVCGGLVSFIISRNWAFATDKKPVTSQFSRFVLVWFGSAAVNTAGLFVTTHLLGIQYLIAKVGVSILVGVSYNYILQKDFIFSRS